jgi:hypothetical protein
MRSGLPFACFCIFSCSSILLSGSIKSPTSFDFSRCLDQDDQTISLPTVNAAATAGATSDGSLGLTCVSEACTLPICKLSHREFLPFGRASVVYTRFKDGLLGDPHGHDTHGFCCCGWRGRRGPSRHHRLSDFSEKQFENFAERLVVRLMTDAAPNMPRSRQRALRHGKRQALTT